MTTQSTSACIYISISLLVLVNTFKNSSYFTLKALVNSRISAPPIHTYKEQKVLVYSMQKRDPRNVLEILRQTCAG